MSGDLSNFDPDQVTVTWVLAAGLGSVDLGQGLIDGPGAITETKDAPKSTRRSDRQSNYVRNKRSAKGGTLALTYAGEAEIHDVLSAIAAQDELLGNQVGDIVVKDLNGTTLMTYRSAHIEDDPTIAFGDTTGDKVWLFGCAQRVPFIGGQTRL